MGKPIRTGRLGPPSRPNLQNVPIVRERRYRDEIEEDMDVCIRCAIRGCMGAYDNGASCSN